MRLWGEAPGAEGSRTCGPGRILWGRGLDAVVGADELAPDVEFREPTPQAQFDFIHRRDGDRDIYFLCSLSREPAAAEVWFRTSGKQPELWDAVTGDTRWDSPENEICIATGPIAGNTNYPGSGKSLVTTISPQTGIPIDSNVGGHFGPVFALVAGIAHVSLSRR